MLHAGTNDGAETGVLVSPLALGLRSLVLPLALKLGLVVILPVLEWRLASSLEVGKLLVKELVEISFWASGS